ncbi:MAG: hypothetical protein GY913_15285 [Proteobacteria bacterium]|nr:hypothetical protein [Pseudomonadota bacterium]
MAVRYWLLDLTIGGEVFRRTDAPEAQTLTDAAGNAVVYEPGLDALEVPRPHTWEAQIGVVITDDTDWATYGSDIEEGRATLSRWTEGTAPELAIVVADGHARDIEWGEQGEGLALTVAVDATDSDFLLGPQSVMDAKTWPTGEVLPAPYLPDDSAGSPYVLPIGYPGHAPTIGGPYTVVPIVLCEVTDNTPLSDAHDRLFLASGRIDADAVRITNAAKANYTASDLPPATVDDLLGALCTYTDFQTDGALKDTKGETTSYYAGYQNDATYGGGLLDPYAAGAPLRGAGTLIRWALRRTGQRLRVDWGDLDRHLSWFDGYKIDTWVNDPEVRGLEWLDATVLPLVPHRWVQTPRGLSLRPWRWTATAQDAIAHYTAPADGERTSSLRVSNAGRRTNEVTVRYRPMRAAGLYRSARMLTAQAGNLSMLPGASEDTRIQPDQIAAASQKRYGVHPLTVEVPQTWDDGTAGRHARDLIWAHALPHTSVTWRMHDAAAERHQPGDVVLLTDSDLGMSERVALVESVTVGAPTGPLIEYILPHALLGAA